MQCLPYAYMATSHLLEGYSAVEDARSRPLVNVVPLSCQIRQIIAISNGKARRLPYAASLASLLPNHDILDRLIYVVLLILSWAQLYQEQGPERFRCL